MLLSVFCASSLQLGTLSAAHRDLKQDASGSRFCKEAYPRTQQAALQKVDSTPLNNARFQRKEQQEVKKPLFTIGEERNYSRVPIPKTNIGLLRSRYFGCAKGYLEENTPKEGIRPQNALKPAHVSTQATAVKGRKRQRQTRASDLQGQVRR
jgi:hypothetical protein